MAVDCAKSYSEQWTSCRNNKVCKVFTRIELKGVVSVSRSRFNIHETKSYVRRVQFCVQFFLRTFSIQQRKTVPTPSICLSSYFNPRNRNNRLFLALCGKLLWSSSTQFAREHELREALKSILIPRYYAYCRSGKGAIKSKLMTFYMSNKGKHFTQFWTGFCLCLQWTQHRLLLE